MKFVVVCKATKEFLKSTSEGFPLIDVVTFTSKRDDAMEFSCPVVARAEALKIQKHDPDLAFEIEADQKIAP